MEIRWRLPLSTCGVEFGSRRDWATGEQTWSDASGGVFAHCTSAGRRFSMHIPGVATFHFESGNAEVWAQAETGAVPAEIHDLYRGFVLPMALQALGFEVLHASSILTPAGVVAWCAGTGTGKSTLAYGLHRRGWPLWSDDIVVWRIAGNHACAYSVESIVHLRAPSQEHFDTDETLEVAPPAQERPIAAINILERLPSDAKSPANTITRLSPTAGFSALLAHAYCFSLTDHERKRHMAESYLALAARLPIWSVRFQGGLDLLDGLLDQVEAGILAAQ